MPVRILFDTERWDGQLLSEASNITARYCESVDAVGAGIWDAFLPGEGEDWSYYRLLEDVPPPAFELGVIVVEEDGAIIAFAPVFRTAYRFDTSLQGAMRQVTNAIHRVMPRLVSMDVLSLGSPNCDNCHIGFAPHLSSQRRQDALERILACLRARARKCRVPLIAAKGFETDEADAFGPVFDHAGYARVTSVTNVVLELPFATTQGYLASLPDGTARYLQRKWRSEAKVEIWHPDDIDAIKDEINTLYASTLAQSRWDYGNFGPVHPDYFATVLKRMPGKARIMVCRTGDRILSFQLYVSGAKATLAKGIGMHYPEARDLNLYFLNWKKMIEYCLAHRIPRISMAGTTYRTKLMIGGALKRHWIFFRFTNPVMNKILPRLAPAFDFENNDPELKSLAAETGAAGADAGKSEAPRAASGGAKQTPEPLRRSA